MAVTSTGSSTAASSSTSTTTTSTLAGANGSLGNGTVIDVNAIISKLDAVEQAPIDAVNNSINQNSVAISDLGTLQSKMGAFQAALQQFTDPLSYLNKTINSSDTTVATAAVSSTTVAQAGTYAVSVSSLASSFTESFGGKDAAGKLALYTIASPTSSAVTSTLDSSSASLAQFFGLSSGNTFTLQVGSLPKVTVDLSVSTNLNAIRDVINQSSSTSGIHAAVVDTGYGYSLTISTVSGGGANSIKTTLGSTGTGSAITPTISQDGADAVFTINGQSFTRSSNDVLNAIPGVDLQLQKAGTGATALITVAASSASNGQTLVQNMIDAFNATITSYNQLTAYNSDPSKRGSLYGDTTLASVMNSISYSLMTGFKDLSGNPLLDNNNKPISMTTLGLELQLDGTISFNSSMFNNSITAGVFDKLSQGFTSPTKSSVDQAIGISGYTGLVANDVSSLTDQNTYLQTQVKDMTSRKADKMAQYQAQYAALDALLYQLQSTNNSLTPTFNALNNPNKTN